MISSETIKLLLDQVNLADLIGDYLPLQKKGQNYWAVCPFHDDQSPSMAINNDKKIYKCFSCGASGNAIDFVKNYAHLEFLQTLRLLAEKANFDIPELHQTIAPKYSPEEEKLFKINEKALAFYQVLLASQVGLEARQYLTKRSFTTDETLFWGLGWASSEISLYETLLNEDGELETLREAGLITIKDGKVYDYFFNRLIFPIKNEDGKILGFSGRALDNETKPKYLNTRETLIFKKSHLMFNIDKALPIALAKKKLLILEGFFDVMSLAKIGLTNAIALMGTNFSDYHIQMIKKWKITINLFLDGDEPGMKANLKAAYKLLTNQILVMIIDNETKFDPDELANQSNTEILQKMVNNPQNPLFYAINKMATFVDLQNTVTVKTYLNTIFTFLALNADPIIRDRTWQMLTTKTGLSSSAIQESFQLFLDSKTANQITIKPIAHQSQTNRSRYQYRRQSVVYDAYAYSQRDILHSLITSPINLEKIKRQLNLIPNPDLYLALKELINQYETKVYQPQDWKNLIEIFEMTNLNYRDDFWQLAPGDRQNWQTPINLDNAFLTLEEYHLRQKEKSYTMRIKTADTLEAQQNFLKAKEAIHQEIINIRKKRQ